MNKRLHTILKILRNGDIILISNEKFNIVSKGIMWFTQSRWNHSVFYYSDANINHPNSRITKKSFNWIYHWTTWTARKDKIKRYIKEDYKICIRRYEDLTPKQGASIVILAKKDVALKRKYAKKAYMGYVIANGTSRIPFIGRALSGWIKKKKNPWRQYNQKVCSSGIIERWFKEGISKNICSRIGVGQTTPEDIYRSIHLKTVYEEI